MQRHRNPKKNSVISTRDPDGKYSKRPIRTSSPDDFASKSITPDDAKISRRVSLSENVLSQLNKKAKKKRKHCHEIEPTEPEKDESKIKRLKSESSRFQNPVLSSQLKRKKQRKIQDNSSQNIDTVSSQPATTLSSNKKVPHPSHPNSQKSAALRKVRQHSSTERSNDDDDESEDNVNESEKTLPYQQLRSVTKNVPRHRIQEKWSALSPSCIDHISGLLQDIQRSTIVPLSDERKRQASATIQTTSRKILNKISKGLPFPLCSRKNPDTDFNFEKILNHSKSLENQLTPALHANELLKSKLREELEYLNLEQEKLVELKTNAKKELALRNETSKKLHPILREYNDKDVFNNEKDIAINFKSEEADRPLFFNVNEYKNNDRKIEILARELHGHVISLHNNSKQVEGIREAMLRAKAALQATLFNHLKDRDYDDIVMGDD